MSELLPGGDVFRFAPLDASAVAVVGDALVFALHANGRELWVYTVGGNLLVKLKLDFDATSLAASPFSDGVLVGGAQGGIRRFACSEE